MKEIQDYYSARQMVSLFAQKVTLNHTLPQNTETTLLQIRNRNPRDISKLQQQQQSHDIFPDLLVVDTRTQSVAKTKKKVWHRQ